MSQAIGIDFQSMQPEVMAQRATKPAGVWLGVRLFLQPRRAGRALIQMPVWRTVLIALINLLCLIPWTLLVQTTLEWVQNPRTVRLLHDASVLQTVQSTQGEAAPHGWLAFFGAVQRADIAAIKGLEPQDFSPLIGGPLFMYTAAIAITYFMLLPFVARHGSNRAAARQTVKITLSATAMLHVLGAALIGFYGLLTLLGYPPEVSDVGITDTIVRSLGFAALTMALGIALLTRVAAVDYRWPEDLPKTRDPLCEHCGYNLTMTPMESRCPECGTPAVESLSPTARGPTAWERAPYLSNVAAIGRQLRLLTTHPRTLFKTMLLYTQKQPAERWLKLSMIAVALAGFLVIFPGTLPVSVKHSTLADAPNLLANGITVGVLWMCLALMMVGVETTGLSTFSKMRGNRVDFAAAAKVTSYSAPLMLFWVFLGGSHLLLAYYFFEHKDIHGGGAILDLVQRFVLTHLRFVPYIAVGSLAAAHIGGLLWFEFTVYRGLKTIQYANE
jgi:hypothetical protein